MKYEITDKIQWLISNRIRIIFNHYNAIKVIFIYIKPYQLLFIKFIADFINSYSLSSENMLNLFCFLNSFMVGALYPLVFRVSFLVGLDKFLLNP